MYTLKNRKKTWFEVTANKYFIAKQSYTKPATEESSMSSVHDHYVGSVSSGTFLLSAVDVNIKSVHSSVKVFIPSNVGKSAFTLTKEALCTTGVRAVGEGRYKRDRKVSKRWR